MALAYLFDPNNQFQDRNGANNVAGFLRVFLNGTDHRARTYKNFEGTLNPSDIPLDNDGRAVVIVNDEAVYRIEVYSRNGNLLWTQYPISPSLSNAGATENRIHNLGIVNIALVLSGEHIPTPVLADYDKQITQYPYYEPVAPEEFANWVVNGDVVRMMNDGQSQMTSENRTEMTLDRVDFSSGEVSYVQFAGFEIKTPSNRASYRLAMEAIPLTDDDGNKYLKQSALLRITTNKVSTTSNDQSEGYLDEKIAVDDSMEKHVVTDVHGYQHILLKSKPRGKIHLLGLQEVSSGEGGTVPDEYWIVDLERANSATSSGYAKLGVQDLIDIRNSGAVLALRTEHPQNPTADDYLYETNLSMTDEITVKFAVVRGNNELVEYDIRNYGNYMGVSSHTETTLLSNNGDGSNLNVTPDGTSTGTAIGDNTTLKAFVQKFKNLVGSLKALAFKDKADLTSDVSNVLPIANGGTGASTAPNARTNLDVYSKAEVNGLLPVATTTTPKMDGTAAVGSETTWAKGDHVHPTDTSREAVANKNNTLVPSSETDYVTAKGIANFVNSSIATNTANFLGSFTLVQLGLTYPATDVQIAAALNSHTWPNGVTVTNNDYVYVEIQNPQTTGVDDRVERYKYSDALASWGYEYTLNNSSFTAAEIAALESGINATKVGNYDSHLTNTNNPHGVTKSQVGLGNVVNTGDSATPAQNGTDKFTTGGAYTEFAKAYEQMKVGKLHRIGCRLVQAADPSPKPSTDWIVDLESPNANEPDGYNRLTVARAKEIHEAGETFVFTGYIPSNVASYEDSYYESYFGASGSTISIELVRNAVNNDLRILQKAKLENYGDYVGVTDYLIGQEYQRVTLVTEGSDALKENKFHRYGFGEGTINGETPVYGAWLIDLDKPDPNGPDGYSRVTPSEFWAAITNNELPVYWADRLSTSVAYAYLADVYVIKSGNTVTNVVPLFIRSASGGLLKDSESFTFLKLNGSDYMQIRDNVTFHALSESGDSGNTKPTFSMANVVENIVSGTTLSTMLGKIAKWYAYGMPLKANATFVNSASFTVQNNKVSYLTNTSQTGIVIDVEPVATDEVPNFAVEIDNTNGAAATITVRKKVGSTYTALKYSVSAGNQIVAGSYYQLTCVGDCWTIAEFEAPSA